MCRPPAAWRHRRAGPSKVLYLLCRLQVWQVAEDLSQADVVLRLPGYSPMPAFKDVVDVPLVVRHARRSREEVGSLILTPVSPSQPQLLLCVRSSQK